MGGALVVTEVGHAVAALSSNTSGSDDTRALVKRAQRGDGDAFAALVSSHDAEVRRVTLRIVRDVDDAEDMAQEVWLRVTEKITQISEPDSFRAWVRSVARNLCLNFLRRKRTIEHALPAPNVATDAIPVAAADEQSSSPEREVLRRDDQRTLWEALGALSEQDRTVLRLRELEDRGYGDIGTTLGTSAHAAEVRGSRARDRLRRQISVVDEAHVPCNANPLRLRAFVEHRSGETTWASDDDHVWSCPSCRHRLAAMGIGRNSLSGLAGLVLLPGGLMATLNHIRAAVGRGYASLGGTQLVARLPLSAPVSPALDSGASLLTSGGGIAVVAAVLSMAMGFGAVPADASDENAVTEVVQLLAPSARAGAAREAVEDGLLSDHRIAAIAASPIETPTSMVPPGAGAPGPSASEAPGIVRTVEAPQPTYPPAGDASPAAQPTSAPTRPLAASPSAQPTPPSPARAAPAKATPKAGVEARQVSAQAPTMPEDRAMQGRGNGPAPQQASTRATAEAREHVDATDPARARQEPSERRQEPSEGASAAVARANEHDTRPSTPASTPPTTVPQPDSAPSDHSHGPRDVMGASVTSAGVSSVTAERGKGAVPPSRKG